MLVCGGQLEMEIISCKESVNSELLYAWLLEYIVSEI